MATTTCAPRARAVVCGLASACVIAAGGCKHPVDVVGLSGSSATETSTIIGDATLDTATSDAESTTTAGTAAEEETGATDDAVKFDMPSPEPEIPPAPDFPQTCAEAAQGTTSVGCEFYPLAVVQNLAGGGGSTGFVVANVSSSETARVTLSDRAGIVDTHDVAAGDLHLFVVDATHQLDPVTGITGDGYLIESDQPLQVWSFSPPTAGITNDAGLVLPREALGLRHRVSTYNAQVGAFDQTFGDQWFAVVATEDATEVTVELAQPASVTLAGGDVPALDYDAGETTTTVVLDRLEVLTIAATNADPNTMAYTNELTGSQVRANQPVAVYAGTPPTYLPASYPHYCCADLITDAVPPTAVWGQQYAGAKFLPLGSEPDVWRFIADRDGTVIELEGGVQQSFELDAGEFVDLETAESFWARGNEAFGMVHFMVSSDRVQLPPPGLATDDCGDIATPGDPAFSWQYPAGNWLNRYLFPVGIAHGWCHEHATLVAPLDRWGEITFGGEPLPAATPLGESGFGYAYIRASAESYEVIAPDGVGIQIEVYGYQDDGSFVYPGGVGLQKLNPQG